MNFEARELPKENDFFIKELGEKLETIKKLIFNAKENFG